MTVSSFTREDGVSRLNREVSQPTHGLWRELIDLLRYNKKWWLIPIVLMVLLAGLFIVLSGSVFAPFIYPLF